MPKEDGLTTGGLNTGHLKTGHLSTRAAGQGITHTQNSAIVTAPRPYNPDKTTHFDPWMDWNTGTEGWDAFCTIGYVCQTLVNSEEGDAVQYFKPKNGWEDGTDRPIRFPIQIGQAFFVKVETDPYGVIEDEEKVTLVVEDKDKESKSSQEPSVEKPTGEEGEYYYKIFELKAPEEEGQPFKFVPYHGGNLIERWATKTGGSSSGSSDGSSEDSDGSDVPPEGSSDGSSSSESSGSDKSTAIVPVPAHLRETGYCAWYVMEGDRVYFFAMTEVDAKRGKTIVPIDDIVFHCMELGSQRVILQGERGAVYGRVKGKEIIIQSKHWPFPRTQKVQIMLYGIRRGFKDVRNDARTPEQFRKNEKFINSAY